MLKNALFALHPQKSSIYFNQTCTDVSLGNAKRVDKILMTSHLDSIFKIKKDQRKLKKK